MSGQSQHDRDSAELRKLCAERDTLAAENERIRGNLQSLIDQTTPLGPIPGDPMWSKRIRLDDVIRERDAIAAELAEIKNSMAYRASLIGRLEAELATLKAGAGEPVEVVAWLLAHEKGGRAVDLNSQSMQVMQQTVGGVVSGLMTVAQHNRIIALDDQPQPAQDISGLVSALTSCKNELRSMIDRHNVQSMHDGSWLYDHQSVAEADQALAKIAQRGGKA